jgi:hypothetical protein
MFEQLEGCALLLDGTLSCWPDGGFWPPPTGTYTQLSCGRMHACALSTTNEIACWGYDVEGCTTPPE